jgi:hypothetical protein
MSCSNTSSIFFETFAEAQDVSTDPGSITILASPAAGTALLWLIWETSPRACHRLREWHSQALLLIAALILAAQSLVVWRFFELLVCAGTLDGLGMDESTNWGIVGVVTCALFNIGVILGVGRKLARTSVLLLFVFVAVCLFGEYALRGGIVLSLAAPALTIIQQLECVLCVIQINKVTVSRRGARRVVHSPFGKANISLVDVIHPNQFQQAAHELGKSRVTWLS